MKFIEVDEIGYENALGRGKSLVNVNGIESIRSGEFTEIRMMSGGIIPCRDSVESIKSKMSGQWLYSYSDLQNSEAPTAGTVRASVSTKSD